MPGEARRIGGIVQRVMFRGERHMHPAQIGPVPLTSIARVKNRPLFFKRMRTARGCSIVGTKRAT